MWANDCSKYLMRSLLCYDKGTISVRTSSLNKWGLLFPLVYCSTEATGTSRCNSKAVPSAIVSAHKYQKRPSRRNCYYNFVDSLVNFDKCVTQCRKSLKSNIKSNNAVLFKYECSHMFIHISLFKYECSHMFIHISLFKKILEKSTKDNIVKFFFCRIS